MNIWFLFWGVIAAKQTGSVCLCVHGNELIWTIFFGQQWSFYKIPVRITSLLKIKERFSSIFQSLNITNKTPQWPKIVIVIRLHKLTGLQRMIIYGGPKQRTTSEMLKYLLVFVILFYVFNTLSKLLHTVVTPVLDVMSLLKRCMTLFGQRDESQHCKTNSCSR